MILSAHSDDEGEMIRIVAPHFVAGLIVDGNRIVKAADIVDYMTGWAMWRVTAYCEKNGWTVEPVSTPDRLGAGLEPCAPLQA